MANKKISDLTAATSLGSTDLFEIETAGGNSRKLSASLLSGASAPSIVQAAYQRVQSSSNANITLGAAPTVGNLLVLLWMGPGGSNRSTPPSTFTLVEGNFQGTTVYGAGLDPRGAINQGGYMAIRRVQSGDTAVFATGSNGADNSNFALFEVADANVFEAEFVGLQMTSSTAFIAHKRRQSYSSLRLLFIEHDGTQTITFNTVTGVTSLNQFTGGGSTNHCASIAQIADTYDSDVAGAFSAAPTTPVAMWAIIAKR